MNFHQFAFRVIKENAASFGVDPDSGVATPVDLSRIKSELYRKFESGTLPGCPEVSEDELPVPGRISTDFNTYMSVIERARGRLWTPEGLFETVRQDDSSAYRRLIETIVAVWRNYEAMLVARGLIDFDGMIRMTVAGLRDKPSLRKLYGERFEHVLVDEFQDTSEAQNELLRAIAGDDFNRVTVVGDDKQSIYRWRNARVENLREFSGKQEHLNVNYRSRQAILDLAHRFIVEDPYFAEEADKIHLTAERAGDATVCIFHPSDDDAARSFEQEAWALAAWIQSLVGNMPAGSRPFDCMRRIDPPLGYEDIAVLMRSLKPGHGLDVYERVFRELGIPYTIHGGVSALENRVIELFKHLLTLIVHPSDHSALLGLLEARPFSIADESLMAMFRAGTRLQKKRTGKRYVRPPAADVLLGGDVLSQIGDGTVRERCVVLKRTIDDLTEKREQLALPDFVAYALESSQYYFQFLADGPDLRLVDAVTKAIVEIVDGLVRNSESSLSALIESLQTVLDEDNLSDPEDVSFPEGRVRVMTIHLAKGLEFAAVAVPGIKNQRDHKEPFHLVAKSGLYITDGDYPYRRREDGMALVTNAHDKEQEERCLLYVAMTRAEDHLFVSSPYAGGLEGKKKTPNYFASILGALDKGDVAYEELRDATHFERARPAEGSAVARSTVDLAALLDEWREGRERLEFARVTRRRRPRGVSFVNWRGLLTYMHCPLQYYYQFIGGLPSFDEDYGEEPAAGDEGKVDGFADAALLAADDDRKTFGQYLHRFLYERLDPAADDDGTSAEHLDRLFEQFEWRKADKNSVIKKAKKQLSAFLKTPLGSRDTVAARELPVRMRLGSVVFHGIVDRIDDVDGGHWIVDYKGKTKSDEHEFQIQFYAWVLAAADDYEVTGGRLCYLGGTGGVAEVDVVRESLEPIEQSARKLADEPVTGGFDATPATDTCRACPFGPRCPDAT
jgi:ATP-dependent exoDNAse (exonuclease V) beta subunit